MPERKLKEWSEAVARAAASALLNLPNNIYIRYGDIPKRGVSKDYSTGKKEKGLSVYHAKKDLLTNTVWPDLADGSLPAAAIVRAKEGAPVYLVKGIKAGKGADGEPVIRNPKIIAILTLHPDDNIAGFVLKEVAE